MLLCLRCCGFFLHLYSTYWSICICTTDDRCSTSEICLVQFKMYLLFSRTKHSFVGSRRNKRCSFQFSSLNSMNWNFQMAFSLALPSSLLPFPIERCNAKPIWPDGRKDKGAKFTWSENSDLVSQFWCGKNYNCTIVERQKNKTNPKTTTNKHNI